MQSLNEKWKIYENKNKSFFTCLSWRLVFIINEYCFNLRHDLLHKIIAIANTKKAVILDASLWYDPLEIDMRSRRSEIVDRTRQEVKPHNNI
jgi:hypothetical protein